MTTYIQKLAYQISPFHVDNFNWNALNAQNQPQQYGNAGGGGNGFMNGLGALMLPMLMNGMGKQEPVDDRTYGEKITDAGKATWNGTKAVGSMAAAAPRFIGENFTPGALIRDAVDPSNITEGAAKMWNGRSLGDLGSGALQMGLGAIAPGVVGGGALYGAMKAAPGMWSRAGGALSGIRNATGLGGALTGGASRGLSGLKSGFGASGLLGKGIGVAGLGINLYDEAAGNRDYSSDMEDFSDIGGWAKGGLRALGNNLSAAAAGGQMAGPVGAVWGAGAHLATGLGRGAWDIYKAKSDGAEAEAGAQKWQDRTQVQQRLKAQMGDERWKKHVELQRAAGKRSWDAPAYAPEALTATPVPTPAPTPTPAPAPAPARTLGKDMGPAPAKPAGPTSSPAIESNNVAADSLKPAPGTVGSTPSPSAKAPGVK